LLAAFKVAYRSDQCKRNGDRSVLPAAIDIVETMLGEIRVYTMNARKFHFSITQWGGEYRIFQKTSVID
jgi:hypothetical protein